MIEIIQLEEGNVALSGEATLHNVDSLHEALKSLWQEDSQDVTIDLSKVSEIDTAAAQVLLAFKQRSNMASVKFVSCPASVKKVLDLAGLSEHLL